MSIALRLAISFSLLAAGHQALAQSAMCSARSGAGVTPVIELYTSEGCSSCPPADQWLSTLKGQTDTVVQAFHVGYWDNLGWVDRFASPAHTQRQRQLAGWNRQASIYTPQAVLDGRDWRDWGDRDGAGGGSAVRASRQRPARAQIALQQRGPDQFEATVTPAAGGPSQWSAYWSVTEDGHSSRVKAGENAGSELRHDFVVRQYVPLGSYRSAGAEPQRLSLRTLPASAGHARHINLVVFDPVNGQTLQALSLGCS